MATVTRAGLARAVHQETGLPQSEAAALVETVIETIAERLTVGKWSASPASAASGSATRRRVKVATRRPESRQRSRRAGS